MYCKKQKDHLIMITKKIKKNNKTSQIKYIVEIPVALEEDSIPRPRWSL